MTEDAGAVFACFGSASAVTFVTAVSFVEALSISFDGHMVAVMALMESPAIVTGVALIKLYSKQEGQTESMGSILKHSLTNGSVLMILDSLLIGYLSDPIQAQGIKTFRNDIFKGFLAIFLLEMGMLTARRLTFSKNMVFILRLLQCFCR